MSPHSIWLKWASPCALSGWTLRSIRYNASMGLCFCLRWSYRKIAFSETDEYSNREWEWLMRERAFEFRLHF